MELRHLRYFRAVAEELHFRRAAEKLHIAQPPLSKQIRELEEEIGAPLFDRRTRRQVRLTAAGEAFAAGLDRLFSQLETVVEDARQAGRGESGRIVIGFASPLLYGILPPLIREFRRRYPGVSLSLRELTTSQQEDGLREESIDAAFVYLPLATEGVASKVILREKFLAALPPDHALTQQAAVAVADLAGNDFVQFPRSLSPGLYDRMAAWFAKSGFEPRVAQEANQMQTMLGLVSAGVGIAVVPESMANLKRSGVIYRPFSGRTPVVETVMVWRKKDSSPALRRFLRMVPVRSA